MTGAFISGVLLTVFAFFLYGKYKAKRGAGGGSGGRPIDTGTTDLK